MTVSAWDDEWTPPDYRADHTHPLVVRALTITCPLPECQAAVSARCNLRGALVHYARIVQATGMGAPKRGQLGASTWS